MWEWNSTFQYSSLEATIVNTEFSIAVSLIDTTTMRGWNSALGFLQLKPPKWEDRIQHFGILQSKQPQWGDGIQHCSAVSSLPHALSKAEIQQLWTQLDSFTFKCRTWSNLLCLQHVQQMWSLAQKTEMVVYLKGFSPSLFPSPKTLQGETFKLHFVEKVFVGEGGGVVESGDRGGKGVCNNI